jgi:hypothetical protein
VTRTELLVLIDRLLLADLEALGGLRVQVVVLRHGCARVREVRGSRLVLLRRQVAERR